MLERQRDVVDVYYDITSAERCRASSGSKEARRRRAPPRLRVMMERAVERYDVSHDTA